MLRETMERFYSDKHGNKLQVAKRERRFESGRDPFQFELFLSGMERQEYEASIREMEEQGDTVTCRLCWGSQGIVYRNELAITADDTPFFPNHMLLRPLKEGSANTDRLPLSEHVTVGWIDKDELDCRDWFHPDDIKTMAQLVTESGYMVTQAMRGSGASIKKHIHGHAFPDTITDFPLLDRRLFRPVQQKNGVSIYSVREPSYFLAVVAHEEQIAEAFSGLRDHFGYASNNIIKIDHPGGTLGVYVPRVKETPSGIIYEDWKFGVFEVLGLFDVKTRAQYKNLDYESLYRAVMDVTVHDPHEQNGMEQFVANTL